MVIISMMSVVISIIKRNHRFIAAFGQIYMGIRSFVLIYHITYIAFMGVLLNGLLFGVEGFAGMMKTPLIYLFLIWLGFELYLYFLVLYVRISLKRWFI